MNLSEKFTHKERRRRLLVKAAIKKALQDGVPFVAYTLPGNNNVEFFAQISTTASDWSRSFAITPWNCKSPIIIGAEIDAEGLLSAQVDDKRGFDSLDCQLPCSTSYMAYCAKLQKMIGDLGRDKGKCVVSRVESYNINDEWSEETIAEIAIKILTDFVAEFAYIFFHPEVGLWIAASPEKLLLADVRNNKFQTIALAGTRPLTEKDQQWDSKNLVEQKYVSDYIADILNKFSLNFTQSETDTLTTGKLQHIVTYFEGELGETDPNELISTLHPTPAIAGWPVEKSLERIAEVESHPRECYSGLVTLQDESKIISYVNLRCMKLSKAGVAFYGGGGITASSDPDAEWRESARKIATLMPYIFPTH